MLTARSANSGISLLVEYIMRSIKEAGRNMLGSLERLATTLTSGSPGGECRGSRAATRQQQAAAAAATCGRADASAVLDDAVLCLARCDNLSSTSRGGSCSPDHPNSPASSEASSHASIAGSASVRPASLKRRREGGSLDDSRGRGSLNNAALRDCAATSLYCRWNRCCFTARNALDLDWHVWARHLDDTTATLPLLCQWKLCNVDPFTNKDEFVTHMKQHTASSPGEKDAGREKEAETKRTRFRSFNTTLLPPPPPPLPTANTTPAAQCICNPAVEGSDACSRCSKLQTPVSSATPAHKPNNARRHSSDFTRAGQPTSLRPPARSMSTSALGRQQQLQATAKEREIPTSLCQWTPCRHTPVLAASGLAEHVRGAHVASQRGATVQCLWKGCKVMGKRSSSRRWLERHVQAHVGGRPYACIVDGCNKRFSSQPMLARHVNTHFHAAARPASPRHGHLGSGPGSGSRPGSLGVSCRKRKAAKRKPAAPPCVRPDFWDNRILERVRLELAGLHGTAAATTSSDVAADLAASPSVTSTDDLGTETGAQTPDSPSKGRWSWVPEKSACQLPCPASLLGSSQLPCRATSHPPSTSPLLSGAARRKAYGRHRK